MIVDYLNSVIEKMRHSNNCIEYYRNGKKQAKPFSEVYKDVCRVVNWFDTLHLTKNDRIGIVGKNSYEWVVLDLACLAKGIVLVPFDVKFHLELAHAFEYYTLKILCSNLEEVLVQNHDKVYSFEHIYTLGEVHDEIIPVQRTSEDIVAFKFTSGTTFRPKAIEAKKKSIDDCVHSIQQMFHHNDSDKIMLFMPLYLLQQRFFIYSAILFEYTLLVIPFELVFHALMIDRPTIVMGVPHFFESLHKNFIKMHPDGIGKENKKEFHALLGNNIRYLWTGSAPISTTTLRFYQEMEVPLFQGYGTSETGIISKNYFDNNVSGSVGKLLPNRSVRFDKQNQIYIKNDYEINTKYFDASPEQNSVFLDDGYVATGDIGYLDDEGYLFINGRIKDLIVLSNGRKVFPRLVEKAIEKSPLITNCVVSGDNQTFLTALLFLAPGVNKEEARHSFEVLNQELSEDEKILKYYFIEDTPSIENGMQTAQRKIKRNFILKKYKDVLEGMYS